MARAVGGRGVSRVCTVVGVCAVSPLFCSVFFSASVRLSSVEEGSLSVCAESDSVNSILPFRVICHNQTIRARLLPSLSRN